MPQPGFIPSSACFPRYLLPVSGEAEPGCHGIPEAAMPGQAAGPGVGREPFPTVAPTVAVHTTVGGDPFPTVAPTVASTGAMAGTVATGQHPKDAPTVAPIVVFRATVGRAPVPTLLPTAVLKATVGRDPFPTLPPTVALDTTVGRGPFPTVPPTVAWQPCPAQRGFSFSWPASVFSVFAAAARTPLYTAPVRELVFMRCIKKDKGGLTTLRRYVLGYRGTSLQRGVRTTERRSAQTTGVTSIATEP